MRVLVVDDSTTSQNIFKETLESFSFEVAVADSGEKALAEFKKAADRGQPYNLIIMDWKMPGMDGIETARKIKEMSNSTPGPNIIMATAYGRLEVMKQARDVGLNGFLIKPVNASVMFNTIMEVFDKDVDRGPRIRARQESEKDTLKTIKGASVLLVEDNEINQQVAREILSDAGLEVTLANDGQEAVDAVQQNKFDAVLMDIQMPVMDGYESTRKIREWEGGIGNAEGGIRNEEEKGQASNLQPLTSNIPIIAMTAHAMTGDREKSIQVGMNDHVAKPIDPEALFTTLLKWIQRPADRENHQLPETETSKSSKVEDSDRFPLPFQAEGNDDLPPSLAGFDLAAGLKRLQGNRRLYRKLLLDFANGYREASENIHHALIANDINQVHSLVHNIKGLAGNLSATDLQNAAAEMDSSVKKALSGEKLIPGQLDSNLSAVKKTLEVALASCQTLERSDDKKAGVTSGGSSVSMPPDLARQTAGQLLAAVDMGDITDLKSIAEALKSKSESYTVFSEKITQLAENFDFDGIKKLADELESHK